MQDSAARLAATRQDRKGRERKDRVADCLRKLTDIAGGVEARYNTATCSAFYRGLQTCGSVWHCPLCAAKISEQRRGELARLVEAHIEAGGSVWMTTYTVSHKKYTDLAGLVENFLTARRKMRQGRRGMALRRDFQIVGTVSVLEVTWSPRNGWHPHVHELVFSSDKNMDPDAYDRAARSAWKDAATSCGLTMNVHGFAIDRTFGAVADYIAKFGHEPERAVPWGVEAEMVKGHTKQSRNDDGYTPFAILAAISDGIEKLAPLWREYCRVFKGRKQLNYSPGLKALYEVKDEPDEVLAAAEPEGETLTLVELTPAEWDLVVEARARGGLLELVRTGKVGEVLAGLAEIDIHAPPPAMIGWRVHTPDGDGEVDATWHNPTFVGGWRARVRLDDPPQRRVQGRRYKTYALWDLVVLGSGASERAALLEELGESV